MSDESKRPKAWIVGGGFNYIRLFYDLGCDGATNLDDADFVVFTGGEDVNPELYGEPCMAKTRFNRPRDDKEKAIYEAALEREMPMVGICRGGQFLNVMNKGKLYQHVSNHAIQGTHIARVEIPPFVSESRRRTIPVTSTHHQMMIPTEDAIILLTAMQSLERSTPSVTHIGRPKEDEPDIEAVFYDDTCCLCFQPHPEYHDAPGELVDFFDELLDNFIIPRINRLKPPEPKKEETKKKTTSKKTKEKA